LVKKFPSGMNEDKIVEKIFLYFTASLFPKELDLYLSP
jgi:hypothetical protein